MSISKVLWEDLFLKLKERGESLRESGAFLLAKPKSIFVDQFILLDDLDSDCLRAGNIVFKARGFIKLWNYCQANDLEVISDVHTHPTKWTRQSDLDIFNPMIGSVGHISLIVPSFATGKPSLTGVGIFLYKGNFKWQSHRQKSGIIKLTD